MWARSVAIFTVAVTPLTLLSLACTRVAQAAQVMPLMTSSNSVASGATVAGMHAKVVHEHAARICTVATRSIIVTGMSCEHCANAVRAEVGRLPGVTGVGVDVAAGTVRITGEPVPGDSALREAIEEAGYEFAG